MNEINKWSIYLMFLVAGFATGIGSIGLFPQFWLQYGITGLAVHVVFLALFTYVAILEAEKVMKSGYYFAELYNKVLQKPALLMAIVVTIVLFLSYYTANVMLSLIAPLVGTGAAGRLIAKILMLALVYLVITRAKEKTFLVMAAGSVFFLVVIFLTAIVFRMQIPQGATFLGMGKHMMFAHVGVSLSMIKDAASRAIYGVGLGFAFYLMLGSFMNERFNAKVIIGVGILVQFIVSIVSTFIVIYALAPSSPARFLKYVYGGEEGAIGLMKDLPTILSGHPALLALFALSIFMAGLTSILPAAEVSLQSVEAFLHIGRNKAALYVTLAALAIGVLDSPASVAEMTLKAVTIATFFTAVFELYPVIGGREKPPSVVLAVGAVAISLFLIGGLYALYAIGKAGGIYIGSVVLALVVVLFGIFGSNLVVSPASE